MSAGTQGTYSILIEVKGVVEAGNQIKSLTNSLSQVDSKVKQSSTTLNQAGQGFQRLGQQAQSSNMENYMTVLQGYWRPRQNNLFRRQ